MEHALALVVLTLLQPCRGQVSQPEWFSANLVNDSGYTPKPITEIFTSDSPFTSKNPALFTQPPTVKTSTLPPPPLPNATIVQNMNSPPLQNGELPIQQTPEIMSQVVENPPKNDLPNFLIVFDPRGPLNPNVQPPVIQPAPPTMPQTTVAQNPPTAATVTSSTSQSITAVPSTQATLLPFQPAISAQILSTLSPPVWPLGSMLVYPIPFPGVNNRINSTILPVTATISPVGTASTLSPVPQPANPNPINSKPVLTVRVKAPRGSITNIRINPTTTVRPTTTRRRKPARKMNNNYEGCVNTCNGRKQPICSSPAGVSPINPDKLKGFPSLCHMACHNSFKKEQVYDKVTDGRCGRLRTRIRPVDKNKLNREELSKTQYTIVHNSPETVVEFSPVRQ